MAAGRLGASSAGALLGLWRRGAPYDAGHNHDGPTVILRLAAAMHAAAVAAGASVSDSGGGDSSGGDGVGASVGSGGAGGGGGVRVPTPVVPDPASVAMRKGVATEDAVAALVEASCRSLCARPLEDTDTRGGGGWGLLAVSRSASVSTCVYSRCAQECVCLGVWEIGRMGARCYCF